VFAREGGRGALSESFRGASGALAAQAGPKGPEGRGCGSVRVPTEERIIIWSSEKGSMVDA
jgi:hypothetical protein